MEYYESKASGIPGWDHVLLVPTLKRGSLYVLPLTPDGKKAAGHFWRYWQSENRFRDLAISPGGRTIYVATDRSGVAGATDAVAASKMENPGAILAFTYAGEGTPETVKQPESVTQTKVPDKLANPALSQMEWRRNSRPNKRRAARQPTTIRVRSVMEFP